MVVLNEISPYLFFFFAMPLEIDYSADDWKSVWQRKIILDWFNPVAEHFRGSSTSGKLSDKN